MKRTQGLTRVLSALGQHYLLDDNQAGVGHIAVQFTSDTPHADKDGRYVAVNPNVKDTYGRTVDGVTELRIIADTLAHEVEHVNQSDLASKQEVAEANPDMPQTAGMVANILEDAYIDEQRMQRSPGMRVSHDVKIEALMGNHQRRPRIDTLLDKKGMVPALVETALQVTAAGYGKGLEGLDDDHPLIEFAARWDHIVGVAQEADDVADRLDAIQGAVDLLREYAPDGTSGRDMDGAADDQGGRNLFDDDEAPDLDDLDLDPSDLDRDRDVGDPPDGPDNPVPDADDLDADLDDLSDDPADGWEEPGQEPGADPAGDESDGDGQAGDDAGPDGDDAPDADGDGDGGGDGDAGDPDDEVGDPDGAGGGAGGGDPADEGDTSRVDAVLDQYDPADLEVVR